MMQSIQMMPKIPMKKATPEMQKPDAAPVKNDSFEKLLTKAAQDVETANEPEKLEGNRSEEPKKPETTQCSGQPVLPMEMLPLFFAQADCNLEGHAAMQTALPEQGIPALAGTETAAIPLVPTGVPEIPAVFPATEPILNQAVPAAPEAPTLPEIHTAPEKSPAIPALTPAICKENTPILETKPAKEPAGMELAPEKATVSQVEIHAEDAAATPPQKENRTRARTERPALQEERSAPPVKAVSQRTPSEPEPAVSPMRKEAEPSSEPPKSEPQSHTQELSPNHAPELSAIRSEGSAQAQKVVFSEAPSKEPGVPIAKQIADQFVTFEKTNESEVQLQLYPEELGPVSMKMTLKGGLLIIDIRSSNEHTQQILLASADEIKSLLQAQQPQKIDVSISAEQPHNYAQQQDGSRQQSAQQQEQKQPSESEQMQQTSSFSTQDFLSVLQTLRAYDAVGK